MKHAAERLGDWKERFDIFASASPDVIDGFSQMSRASRSEDAALDLKTLKLISTAIAVVLRCEPCILSHLEDCVDLGITRQELTAALNITALMQGGPGYAYSGFALQAFDQMLEAKR